MAKITGRKIGKKYIELHGQIGEFNIKKKKTKIRYFSTFASSKNKNHDSFELLKELKPMRERIKASELRNLDSMMQRDLNDYRVAKELIPYLVNESPPVAFFPAILAILLPKGFLSQMKNAFYPLPETDKNPDNNTLIDYDDKWKLEIFSFENQDSTLGLLSIDVNEVDIVVLDGQHRANAFRVISGTFDNANNSIYSGFYKGIDEERDFEADLPVTIIWFENKSPEFDPKLVSRRLFVDVNNTAKKVSKSRTILLDEIEIPSLLTRFFYSSLAEERGFKTNKMSLFHSDFDLNSDINVSSSNVFSVTNPQIVYDIFSWLTLGRTERYNALNVYNVSREAFRNSLDRFQRIFCNPEFGVNDIYSDEESFNRKRVIITDVYKVNEFKNQYEKLLSVAFLNIYSNFNLFLSHFKASKEIEDSVSKMDHIKASVWEEVFMSGEGLYYTFKDKVVEEMSDMRKYLSAIKEIENDFKKKRSEFFEGIEEPKINSAFRSANSKAFQIGLFMTLDYFMNAINNESIAEANEDFLSLINKKSANDWIHILTDIRSKVIKGTDPKKWPAYQKIILRSIQNENYVFYENNNFEHSPDGRIFADSLSTSFNAWLELNTSVEYEELSLLTIGNKTWKKWVETAKVNVEDLFSLANIDPIEDVNYEYYGELEIKRLINKIVN